MTDLIAKYQAEADECAADIDAAALAAAQSKCRSGAKLSKAEKRVLRIEVCRLQALTMVRWYESKADA